MFEAISPFHGGLYLRVQSLNNSICNPRECKADHSAPITSDRFGYLNNRLQTAMHRPKIPSLHIMRRISRVLQFPEPRQSQFDMVGSRRLQVQSLQLLQAFRLLCCQILRVRKPEVSRLLQRLIALLLHPADLLNRLVHLAHDMKTVKDHLGMRNVVSQTVEIGIPHVVADKIDFHGISTSQPQVLYKILDDLFPPAFPDIKYSRGLQIAERCHVHMAFAGRKLIDPQNMKLRKVDLSPGPFYLMGQDPPDTIGMFSHKLSHPCHRHLPAQMKYQHLKQQRKTAPRTSPGDFHLLDPAPLASHPRYSRVKIGLVLKKVQMPPCPILGIVDFTFLLFTGRTGKIRPLKKINLQVQLPGLFRKLNLNHLPGLRKSQSQCKKGKFIHQDDSFQLSLHGEYYHALLL